MVVHMEKDMQGMKITIALLTQKKVRMDTGTANCKYMGEL